MRTDQYWWVALSQSIQNRECRVLSGIHEQHQIVQCSRLKRQN
jgi:hypothetical protein